MCLSITHTDNGSHSNMQIVAAVMPVWPECGEPSPVEAQAEVMVSTQGSTVIGAQAQAQGEEPSSDDGEGDDSTPQLR